MIEKKKGEDMQEKIEAKPQFLASFSASASAM